MSLLILTTLIGCTKYNDPAIMASNKKELAGLGEDVGILPDGRHVSRYELDMGDTSPRHWLYVVDRSDSTTLNVTDNKQHHVEVMIDGQTYNLSLKAEAE